MKIVGNEIALGTSANTVANCTCLSLFANAAAQVTVVYVDDLYANGSPKSYTWGLAAGERMLVTKGPKDTVKVAVANSAVAVPVASGVH